MTSSHDFEQDLGAWLRQDSEHRVPDHLEAVLVRTIATRQRPWWSSLRRWLPDVTLPPAPAPLSRSGSWRPILVLAAVALLIAALVLFAVGSRRHVPAPFGLARNGVVVAAVGGDLFQVDPSTGAKTPLLSDSQAHADFGPMFSRDGSRLLYLRGVDGKAEIVIANPDGSGAKVVSPAVDGLDQVDWSPDGSRVVFLSRVANRGLINVVNADGTGLTTFHQLAFPANQVSWLPPDGNAILFRGEQLAAGDPPPAIYTIRPDQTGIHKISSRPAANENDINDVSAAPDGTSILYRESPSKGGFFSIHVLDLRTGRDVRLPAPATAAGQTGPVFSPDGVNVAYLRISAETRANTGPTFQLVVAPSDASTLGTELQLWGVVGDDGPTINNYFFTPDGSAVVANDLATVTEWLLPINGKRGTVIARGTAAYDALSSVQRLAP
jgi:dipeptidyl aminopeptidase/acylaminoacyl peptidase